MSEGSENTEMRVFTMPTTRTVVAKDKGRNAYSVTLSSGGNVVKIVFNSTSSQQHWCQALQSQQILGTAPSSSSVTPPMATTASSIPNNSLEGW